jgi:hypothetical protein
MTDSKHNVDSDFAVEDQGAHLLHVPQYMYNHNYNITL